MSSPDKPISFELHAAPRRPVRQLGIRIMRSSSSVVVFADVDQGFLASGSSAATSEGEELLAREHVNLVLCSSMTRAELEVCQQGLGIRQPFICESGAAVLVPHEYFPFDVPCDRELPGFHVMEFGRPYSEIVALLHRASMRLGIPVIGFSDLSIEQVADQCQLTLSQARLAKLREYNEPFRLVNPARDAHDRLWKALRAVRLDRVHRASYEHVGASIDKRTSVDMLISFYRRAFGAVVTVGLGNGANSSAIFHRVTVPVVAGAAAALPGTSSQWRISRLDVAIDRGPWMETIIELARRARVERSGTANVSRPVGR